MALLDKGNEEYSVDKIAYIYGSPAQLLKRSKTEFYKPILKNENTNYSKLFLGHFLFGGVIN